MPESTAPLVGEPQIDQVEQNITEQDPRPIPPVPTPKKPVYSLKLRKCFGNLRYRQCVNPTWLRSDFLEWAMENGYHDGMCIRKRDKNLVHSPANSYFVVPPATINKTGN